MCQLDDAEETSMIRIHIAESSTRAKTRFNMFLNNAQKMKFSIKDLFSKCDQICSFLRIWSDLLKKSLIENFIFVQWMQFFHWKFLSGITLKNPFFLKSDWFSFQDIL